LYEQVDEHGQTHVLFNSIVDHKKGDDAIGIEDGFVVTKGRQHPKQTTRGCDKFRVEMSTRGENICGVPV
jgi:hypothetical protein